MSIGCSGAAGIAEYVTKTNTLKALVLSETKFPPTSVEQLGSALSENKSITHLELASNSLGNDGAKLLANGLKKNTTLTYIDVSCKNKASVLTPNSNTYSKQQTNKQQQRCRPHT